MDIANEISAKTPNLCHLAPAGPTYMEDLNEAGGVYAVMNEISKLGPLKSGLHDCNRQDRRREHSGLRQQEPGDYPSDRQSVHQRPAASQFCSGNLAPDSCVVKRSAVAPEMLVHEGPARVFDCEEDAIAAIKGGKIVAGDVVVIRYEGPKGGPGMREMLNPTSAIVRYGPWLHRSPDHRRPFQRRVPRRFHRPCEPGGSRRRPDRHWWKRAISSPSISMPIPST